MSKSTLFEIADDMQALEALLEEAQGDGGAAEVVAAWLDELEGALVDKVDRCAAVVRTLEARAKMRADEAKRLAVRAKVDENAAKRLLEALKYVFEAQDIKSLETAHYRVTLAARGSRAVDIPEGLEPHQLPTWGRRDIPARSEPNKDALRDYVKEFGPLVIDGKAITLKEPKRSIGIR